MSSLVVFKMAIYGQTKPTTNLHFGCRLAYVVHSRRFYAIDVHNEVILAPTCETYTPPTVDLHYFLLNLFVAVAPFAPVQAFGDLNAPFGRAVMLIASLTGG
ncbi:MAG: hypothetical protein WDN46_20555 [Methylocella sp.]